MRKIIALVALAALVMTGCAAGSGESDVGQETLPTAPSEPGLTTVPDSPVAEPGDTAPPKGDDSTELPGNGADTDKMVDAAIADLSERLSVDSHAITVALVESVTWPDGAVGCPLPGMSYTQALVDGVRIELTLDGESYWYHQGGSDSVRYCEEPEGDEPGSSSRGVPGGSKFIPPTTTP